MLEPWNPSAPGVLELPSGRRVRGRSLRKPLPVGPLPTCTFCLLGKSPPQEAWDVVWLPWRDFRLPHDVEQAAATFIEAYARAGAEDQRLEIACSGGRGRTGTALACLAVLDGVPNGEAVRFVRDKYDRRAVEPPGQKLFVRRFQVDG